MATYKLPAGIASDPRALTAGLHALGLYAALGDWSANNETYGVIPAAVADHFGTDTSRRKLVDVGLWKALDGAYEIVDWAPANKTRDQVQGARKRSAERMKSTRSRRKAASFAESHDVGSDTTPAGQGPMLRRNARATQNVSQDDNGIVNENGSATGIAGQGDMLRCNARATHAQRPETESNLNGIGEENESNPGTAGQGPMLRCNTNATENVAPQRICTDQAKVLEFDGTAGQGHMLRCNTNATEPDLTTTEPRATRGRTRAPGSPTYYVSGENNQPNVSNNPTQPTTKRGTSSNPAPNATLFDKGETNLVARAASTPNSRTDRASANAHTPAREPADPLLADTETTRYTQLVQTANARQRHAADLVAQTIPPAVATGVKVKLAEEILRMLNQPHPPTDHAITTGLTTWTQRAGSGPRLLPHLISDATLAETRPTTQPTPTPGAAGRPQRTLNYYKDMLQRAQTAKDAQ